MKAIKVKTLPDDREEYGIELTKEERDMIKAKYGWQRLTSSRLQWWFKETLDKKVENLK